MVKREAGLMPDSRRKTPPPSIHAPSDASSFLSGLLSSVQVTSSVLFRLVVYVFLRWIPTSIVWPTVPVLYAVYTLTWLVQQWRLASVLESASAIEELGRSLPVTGHKLGSSTGAPMEHEAEKLTGASEKQGESSALLPTPATDSPVETATTPTRQAALPPPPSSASPSLWSKISPFIFGGSSRSAKANVISFGVHTLLMLFFLDAYSSPYLFPSHEAHNLHFARVGALTPTTATIHVRYPFPLGEKEKELTGKWGNLVDAEANGTLEQAMRERKEIFENPAPFTIVYRKAREEATYRDIDGILRTYPKRWNRGPNVTLLAENDWTGASIMEDLEPATQYEWRLMFVHNTSFAPHPHRARKFVTWPDITAARETRPVSVRTREEEDVTPWDDPHHFTFAASSCVKPDFPWLPTQFWAWSWALRLFGYGTYGGFATRNRIPGFDMLAEKLIDGRDRPSIRFFLQLGDLIYADVPRWGGATTEAYRKLYRNLYASESFKRVYERLPVIGIADDHETRNNWSGYELEEREDEAPQLVRNKVVPFAMQAWREYVGLANPAPLEPEQMYYTFRYGDSAFFVLDTRGHRVPPQVEDDEKKTMLGHQQKAALIRWLGAVNSSSTFKFIVSSVPMTTLWGGPLDVDGSTDSWNAYRHEREQLLQVMQYVAGGVIVISGDRHEFAAVGMRAESSPLADQHAVTEISTSPLSMFYLPVKTFAADHGLGPTGSEKIYHYQPTGNIKWTEFEVDTRNPLQPVVTAILKVDGEESYRLKIYGRPIKGAIAMGDMAKSFLELLGFRKRKWF